MTPIIGICRFISLIASGRGWLSSWIPHFKYCQTLGLVLRLRVDFVLPLSQEKEQEQEQEEEEQPLTKIYQKGVN